MLLEEFMERFEAWVWEWSSREDSNAQGLWHEGVRWSPLELWKELAPVRRIPARERLERLMMRGEARKVDRGRIMLGGEQYEARELHALSGQKVWVRWTPGADHVVVDQVIGQGPLAQPLRVPRVKRVGLLGGEEVASANAYLTEIRKQEQQRVRELAGDRKDWLGQLTRDVVERGRGTNRGQVAGISGRVIQLETVERTVMDGTSSEAVEEDEAPIFTSYAERDAWERRHGLG